MICFSKIIQFKKLITHDKNLGRQGIEENKKTYTLLRTFFIEAFKKNFTAYAYILYIPLIDINLASGPGAAPEGRGLKRQALLLVSIPNLDASRLFHISVN